MRERMSWDAYPTGENGCAGGKVTVWGMTVGKLAVDRNPEEYG